MLDILGFTVEVSLQVLVLFMLIFTGVLLFKTKLVNNRGADQLVNILFYAVTPVLVIHSFTKVGFTPDNATALLTVAVCSFLAHAVAIIVSILIFRKKGPRAPLLRTSVIFSNCGFMSIPLADALLGAQGVFLVSAYVAVNNLIIWTVGVKMFTGGNMSLKKAFINPGVIGIVIGLPLFFAGVNLPSPITESMAHISNLNTPVAMIIIGCYLASASLKFQKGDGQMWTAFLCRLVIVPLLCVGLFTLMGVSGNTLMAIMIPASAPTAASVMMFTAKFGGDTKMASRIVPISTLISILTMPLILTLVKYIISL